MCDFYVDGGTKILWLVVILEEDQIRSRHICKPWSHIDVNSVTFSLYSEVGHWSIGMMMVIVVSLPSPLKQTYYMKTRTSNNYNYFLLFVFFTLTNTEDVRAELVFINIY